MQPSSSYSRHGPMAMQLHGRTVAGDRRRRCCVLVALLQQQRAEAVVDRSRGCDANTRSYSLRVLEERAEHGGQPISHAGAAGDRSRRCRSGALSSSRQRAVAAVDKRRGCGASVAEHSAPSLAVAL